MKRHAAFAGFALAAACSSGTSRQSATPIPSAAPSLAAATPLSTVTPLATAPGPATASPSPQPTQNPNLLTFQRGTFVRSWTPGVSNSAAQALAMGQAYAFSGTPAATPELVFELPAVANIREITASALVPAGATAQLDLAAAKERGAFTDVGTISLDPGQGTSANGSLQGPISARWLRVRVRRNSGGAVWIESLVAAGDLTVPAASFRGKWSLAENINGADAVFGKTNGDIPEVGASADRTYGVATDEQNGSLIAAACTLTRDVWRGPIAGGSAQVNGDGSLSVVDDGSLLVGYASGGYILARRVAHVPDCELPPVGRGPTVAIITRYTDRFTRLGTPKILPGYRFTGVLLPLMDANDLREARVAVLAMSCAAGKDSTPSQQRALLDYVASGHLLVVRDADACSQSDYGFVPYPFTTAASGARAARGSVLSIADSSVLASSDATDREHYVDTAAYLKNYMQQLGDADIMQTKDAHWCGLMFAKNAAGASGWVRAYARYGKGIIVYDGFDADDLLGSIPQAIRLSRLAYDLSPSADLPCNAHVASSLTLLSSVHRNVAFGTARDERFGFVIDREGGGGASEPVALTIAGEHARGWRATVAPASLTIGSGQQRVSVVVHVPAGATATRHLYLLTATGNRGENAQASIQLDVNEALAKQLEKGGRARIYGIHFDVGSARIQPRSESVIRDIATVLRSHRTWRMRVEGYTDSDGGVAYNLALSRRRASSVVKDLSARYSIAPARLRAAGYGLSRPVASNVTDAGKALNRRVELVRF